MKVTEVRKGTIFLENDEPWKTLEYTHTKMGRGNASIRLKGRNLVNGKIRDFTYNSGAHVEEARFCDRTRAHGVGGAALSGMCRLRWRADGMRGRLSGEGPTIGSPASGS